MLPYADAMSNVGSCSNLNNTERAIKHFSAAASCRRRAMFSSEPAASLACGRNVTLSNCPAPSPLLDLHAGGVVAVCYDHDTSVGAKMQVPELMTGGKRGDEQLRRIPSRRIAAEHRVGRAGYGRFALRADLVRTRVGAVRRRAGAPIAGPVNTNRIGVTLVCHGLLRPAARRCRRRLSYRA